MVNYTEEDIKLVLERYYNYSRIPVMSEFLRTKILEFAGDSASGAEYESLYPYTAIWKINSNCNLRCKHCYFYGTDQYATENDLSFDKIKNIIDQFEELGIMEIRLTGGEVFLQKNIFEILKYIKQKNISIIITTNGTLINESIAKKLSEILSPAADIIRVSIDGAKSLTHDKTRGAGVFDKAINSIKLLRNVNLRVFVSSVITNENVKELADLYKLMNTLEVEQMTLIKIVPIDESQKSLLPSFEELVFYSAEMYGCIGKKPFTTIDNRLFTAYDFMRNKLSAELVCKQAEKKNVKKSSYLCHCNTDKSFYIDSDGTVYLCPLAADYKLFPLGNLKTEPLENLFAKRLNNTIFMKRDFSEKKCGNCKIFEICKSGCLMNSYIKHNSFDNVPCA